jgi:hypothetical protein
VLAAVIEAMIANQLAAAEISDPDLATRSSPRGGRWPS